MSVAFLLVSAWGACFTLWAFRPTRRAWLVTPSFFAGWLTSELAPVHLAWQLVATVVFVALGALDAWPGWVGLGITLVSWAGLLVLIAMSRRAAATVASALRDALGDDYEARIAAATPVARRTAAARRLFPLWLRDHRVERIRNLRYAPGAGRRHLLDVYRSRSDHEGPRPVLLQLHGGAWMTGDKSQQARPLMLHLAAAGWVCVAANYRLSPRATWPDHLVDAKAALAWVREHIAGYGGDPDIVVVTGGSAGGHLAAMVALTANDPAFQPGFEHIDTSVAACVPLYGVYDFTDRDGAQADLDRILARIVVKRPRAEVPEVYDRASPMSRVHADAPPFFVVHGTSDNLVPVATARRFVDLLRAVSGAPVAYAEIAGGHHAFEVFHSIRTNAVVAAVDRFLAWVHASARPTSATLTPVSDEAGSAAPGTGPSDPTTTARAEPQPAPSG